MSDLYYLLIFTTIYFICILLIALIDKYIKEYFERKNKKHKKEYFMVLNENYRIIPLESCCELDETEKGNNIRLIQKKIC